MILQKRTLIKMVMLKNYEKCCWNYAEIKDILYENASVVSDNTTEETETLEIVLE